MDTNQTVGRRSVVRKSSTSIDGDREGRTLSDTKVVAFIVAMLDGRDSSRPQATVGSREF